MRQQCELIEQHTRGARRLPGSTRQPACSPAAGPGAGASCPHIQAVPHIAWIEPREGLGRFARPLPRSHLQARCCVRLLSEQHQGDRSLVHDRSGTAASHQLAPSVLCCGKEPRLASLGRPGLPHLTLLNPKNYRKQPPTAAMTSAAAAPAPPPPASAVDCPSAPPMPTDLYAECARPQQSQAGPAAYPAVYPQQAAAAPPGTPPLQPPPPRRQMAYGVPPQQPPCAPPPATSPFPGAPPAVPAWMVAPPEPYSRPPPPPQPQPVPAAYGQQPYKQQPAWDAASPLMAGLVGAGVGMLAGELLSHRHHHHRRHHRFW